MREVLAHFFEAKELHHPFKLEGPLVVMQNVKQDDFVAVVAHPLQGRFERLHVREEVAEDHHDLATTHAPRQLGQALGHVRLLDWFKFVEMVRHAVNLRQRIARRNVAPHAVVERSE